VGLARRIRIRAVIILRATTVTGIVYSQSPGRKNFFCTCRIISKDHGEAGSHKYLMDLKGEKGDVPKAAR
jgi:hypothetical protein